MLLYARALKGKSVTARTIASVCRMSIFAAELHLAKLCARGLLTVEIGTELHYSYNPIESRMRAPIDELDRLFITQRDTLAAWFKAGNRPHVLIAEDDADMREIVRSFMETRGFRATALPHGRESMACAEAESLALSIVDVRPSFAPGLALTRALRRRREPVKTIITTSLGDVRLHGQIAGLGVSAVLEKPFDLEELGKLLERA